MSVETVFDVMELTRKVHHQLARDLDTRFTVEGQERVRMLLAYLSDHEQKLEHVITQAEQDAASAALNTWLTDYLSNAPSLKALAQAQDFASDDAEVVVSRVLALHEHLIALYQYLVDKAPTPAVSQLLAGLMDLERHEAMRMARDVGLLSDL